MSESEVTANVLLQLLIVSFEVLGKLNLDLARLGATVGETMHIYKEGGVLTGKHQYVLYVLRSIEKEREVFSLLKTRLLVAMIREGMSVKVDWGDEVNPSFVIPGIGSVDAVSVLADIIKDRRGATGARNNETLSPHEQAKAIMDEYYYDDGFYVIDIDKLV